MVAFLRTRPATPPGRVRLVLLLIAALALPAGLRAQDPGAVDAPKDTRQMTIEYYNVALGHYFITGIPAEVALLDAGTLPGWTRTGEKFEVWFKNDPGLVAVCRFFSDFFAPLSSHFYTALAHECALLQAGGIWAYEGNVAFVRLPTAGGACETGMPIYRVYNNVLSGAPNHRYTKSTAIRDQMIAQGWSSEGFGPGGVIACVPKD